jgi:uncharacterized membrane protein
VPRSLTLPLLLLLCLLVAPAPAEAYIGPGAGLSVFGTVVAFLGAVLFAIVGFVWYPIKRLLGWIRRSRTRGDDDSSRAET